MRDDDITKLDAAHVWHPYSPWPSVQAPYVVRGASGPELLLTSPSGQELTVVDGMSSWWSVIHGYRHATLDAAAQAQLATMSHVMFGGLTHQPAVSLCSELARVLPGDLRHVFLCDSGSVSVEVAMKMALQACMVNGQTKKTRFLTWRGGYHGDTFMAMSVCDPDGGMHSLWSGVVAQQLFADVPPAGDFGPTSEAYLERFEDLVKQNRGQIAAVIIEPVVQGAGGMRFHSAEIVKAVRAITKEHGVLLICDEIATGFGRTGELFASDHAGIAPDIICVGKAMAGGYLSLAATVCTGEVASRIGSSGAPALMHGPTFMGNPLACAIANASLGILAQGHWRRSVGDIGGWLNESLAAAWQVRGVKDVRVLGAIGVIELDHDVNMEEATSAALARGVWLRPFRNLVYAMPSFIITREQALTIGDAMVAAASA